jgi:uncharacterized protein YegJ (DUF2314 family)
MEEDNSPAPAAQFYSQFPTHRTFGSRRKDAEAQREEGRGKRGRLLSASGSHPRRSLSLSKGAMKYIIVCVILLFSCDKRPASPTLEVERSDKELEKIADNARRALPVFFRNLARPEAGANNYYVKYPLSSDDHTEQVWLGSIRSRKGIYYGTIANTTISPTKKRVTIDTEQITDWMYIQDGKIIGGRSIKYLLEKIPEEKRSEDQRKILKMFE